MTALEQSGIELVVKNAQQAIRDLKAYQSALGQQNKAVTQAAKTGNNTSQALSSLNKDFSEMGKNILSQIPGVGKLTNLLGGLGGAGSSAGGGVAAMGASMSAALPVIGAVAVAVAGITAGFSAFWKTGMRGAELQNTLEAFKNVVGGLEDTNTVLSGLRSATRGTVSDMELMRLTTATLQGQSQEFRQVLLKTENGVTNLGKVLDVTARAARATGQSEEYIREKFLGGLRLQSKLRLDDIGVTVNAVEANEKYAESIGKTAAALTDAEKKQAFLTEALRQLDRIGAEAPVNRVQDLVKQIGVAFQNLKDKIALLVQPIFAPVVEAVSAVVKRVEEGFNNLIYILNPIIKTIGAVFSEALQNVRAVWNLLFGDFDSGARSVMPYIIASFQIAGEAATGMIRAIGSAFRAFISALATIRKAIGNLFSGVGDDVNLNINQLAFNLGKGGALIIGSFAAGIVKAGTYVIQAVTAIAQIVADFLVGFSPPKKGPLANIDKGGENVAVSWVDGFMGGVKSSFSQVTAYVNERLGAIARLSREQIETRLKMLDLALRPFRENLAIVKADMEAIAGFTDPALRIMERQRKSLLKAFGEGKIGDVEQLRNLDRQIQRMKELKEFGQDQVDQAELKLALAQSQQAQERALLNIAKERLGEAEKAAGGGKETGEKATGGGGGGAPDTGAGGGGLGLGGGETPDLLSTEAIDAAKAKILAALASVGASASAGIGEGLAESGFGDALAGFKGQSMEMGKQLKRIQDANPVAKIAEKFSGLKDAVSGALGDFSTLIADTFANLFGEEGSVIMALNSFKTIMTGIFSGAMNPFALANIAMSGLVTTAQAQFAVLNETIATSLTPLREQFAAIFTGEESLFTMATTALTTAVDTMITKFSELSEEIRLRLLDVQTFMNAHFIDPGGIIERVKTSVQSMMDFVINQFFRLTTSGANTLISALEPLFSVIRNAMIIPFHTALSSLANLVADALRSIVDAIGDVLGIAGIDIPTIPQINIPPPMAKGTLGYNKPFIAGENGKPELVMPSKNNPLSVFPGKATSALTAIAGMMNKPAPQPQYIPAPNYGGARGGDSIKDSYNSQKQLTINARQKMTKLEILQLMSRM